jgi:riboflavin-specific deaminase-like protein
MAQAESATARAWRAVRAAADLTPRLVGTHDTVAFTLADNSEPVLIRSDPRGTCDDIVVWRGEDGWAPAVPSGDPHHALLDLYLPICSAETITIGHLGQSLDGFIATHAGESQFVTGEENILHLHRMRALCDAVVVGAGTVAADDPQLTTRLVPGRSPLRVVLDPTRRLSATSRVFVDDAAETLYVCGRSFERPDEPRVGNAAVASIADSDTGVDVHALVRLLRARGCRRIFVEGGGVTVSQFLDAGLLDRLQIAIAPLLIGDGRPAIRIPARRALSDCHRPNHRVFRMGGDVLFDCEIGPDGNAATPPTAFSPITRVI